MTRADTQAVQHALMALRNDGESSLIVSFGTHAPSTDSSAGSVSVTITEAGYSETAEAVYLVDAILMARGKLKEAARARAEKAEKQKAKP